MILFPPRGTAIFSLFALLAASAPQSAISRNPKKGISTFAQSCSTLEPHTDSSWWYTWGNNNGFGNSARNFCYAPSLDPVATARADGMDFVPQLFNSVPDLADIDATFHANLDAATYIMGFNEPEQAAQANLSPAVAAEMWADVVTIAEAYSLQIVAPCMTKDAFDWFDEWETECNALYGPEGCRYEFTCFHLYQQPHPCDVTKPWQCVGDETGYHAKNFINRWYNDYGNKPVWIKEFGCYVWAAAPNGPGCTPQQHQDTMTQLMSIFESPEYEDIVYRYAWFTNYDGGEDFLPGALSVLNWESLPKVNGSPSRCPDMAWVGKVFGGNACNPAPCTTGIKSIGECASKADSNAQCASPLVLTMDRDGCYCSRDSCDTPVATYSGSKSYREVGPLSRNETALTPVGNIYNSFSLPVTPAPTTPVPVTPSPTTPVPVTPAPTTPVPVTPAPTTPVPVTPAPSTPVPATPSPTTVVPVTAAPTSTPTKVSPGPRNPKKGISTSAQSCSTLEPHTDSSWWYTWGHNNGFDASALSKKNFCYAPSIDPVATARADGMDFVPVLWKDVPDLADIDATFHANLDAATYIMSFHEPNQSSEANLSPAVAAEKWADLVTIAEAYNLQIVAPCMKKDAFDWFDDWETECNALYGPEGCRYEFTCIHLYQQPHPCDVTKPWLCIGDETGYHAKNYINRWYNDYGNKPVWITEVGCYVWAAAPNGPGCTPQQHQDTMTQLLSIFESPEYEDIVYRYAWYTNYDGGEDFLPGALSVPNWESLPKVNGSPSRCPNMAWVGKVYGGRACNPAPCTTGIKTIGECASKAESKTQCASPLVLTMDRDGCYCSKDACDTPVATYGGSTSYREVGPLSRNETALTPVGSIYNSFAQPTAPAPVPPPPARNLRYRD